MNTKLAFLLNIIQLLAIILSLKFYQVVWELSSLLEPCGPGMVTFLLNCLFVFQIQNSKYWLGGGGQEGSKLQEHKVYFHLQLDR